MMEGRVSEFFDEESESKKKKLGGVGSGCCWEWEGWGVSLVNICEQMFQMELLLFKENNFAKVLF